MSILGRVVFFWTRNMESRGLDNAHTYKTKFLFCARDGNKQAAEYFLNKLTPMEKAECLVRTAKDIPFFDAGGCFMFFIVRIR